MMLTLPSSCGPSTLYFEHLTKPWVRTPSCSALHWTYASSSPLTQPIIFGRVIYHCYGNSYVQVRPKNIVS